MIPDGPSCITALLPAGREWYRGWECALRAGPVGSASTVERMARTSFITTRGHTHGFIRTQGHQPQPVLPVPSTPHQFRPVWKAMRSCVTWLAMLVWMFVRGRWMRMQCCFVVPGDRLGGSFFYVPIGALGAHVSADICRSWARASEKL
jgi:hypothetical protein